MDLLLTYIIKVSILLLVVYAFYTICLRNTTFYNFNRGFLAGSLFFSFILPLLSVPQAVNIAPEGVGRLLNEVSIRAAGYVQSSAEQDTILLPLVIMGYGIISGLFFTALAMKIARIIRIKRRAVPAFVGHHKVYLIDSPLSSFSFGPWIFIDRVTFESDHATLVVSHEIVHVRQHHTYDLILSEFVKSILWFHPLAWRLKGAFSELHEYMADRAVINRDGDNTKYLKLLFEQVSVRYAVPLCNQFYQPLIKRRFIMITKPKSGKKSAIIIGMGLPATIFACYMLVNIFYFPAYAQQDKVKAVPSAVKVKEMQKKTQSASQGDEKLDKMAEYAEGSDALLAYIIKEVKYPELAKKWGINAKVFIQFVIDEKGVMEKSEVLKTQGSYADVKAKKAPEDLYKKAINEMEAEALRVVKAVPGQWTPAEKKGKKVASHLTLPIAFKLN